MLTAIWAQDKNGLIGKDETLPWHLPNDLKFFKEKTIGHTLVMGRKTYEGMGKRALPKRTTIIMTSDRNYQADNVSIMHSLQEVLTYAADQEEVFIGGGAGIFQAFLPYCEKIYRTVIQAEFEGDTYFPEIDWTEWQLVEEQPGLVDEKNQYPHVFQTWIKKASTK